MDLVMQAKILRALQEAQLRPACGGAAVGAVLTALLIPSSTVASSDQRASSGVATIPARHHKVLVIKSVFVAVAMMVLFFTGQPVAKVAIVGGACCCHPEIKPIRSIARSTGRSSSCFVGLFVVVPGLEMTVLSPEAIAAVSRLDLETTPSSQWSRRAVESCEQCPRRPRLEAFIAKLTRSTTAWLVGP